MTPGKVSQMVITVYNIMLNLHTGFPEKMKSNVFKGIAMVSTLVIPLVGYHILGTPFVTESFSLEVSSYIL